MQAEFNLYSGRPNPRWDLDVSLQAAFTKLLEALPPAPPTDILDGLGYHGITTRWVNGDGIEESVAVSNGVVKRHRGSHTATFTDAGRKLERWLFQTSSGRVPEADRAIVAAELESK